MRRKFIKYHGKFGQSEYQEFTDIAGIIEITRQLLLENPDNPRARLLIDFVDRLGRTPTVKEFEAFLEKHGAVLRQVETIPFEN